MQTPTTFEQNKLKFMGLQIFLAMLLVAGATIYVNKNPVSTIFKAGNQEKEVTLTYASEVISGAAGDTISITPFIGFTQKVPGYISLTFSYDPQKLTFLSADDSHTDQSYEVLIPPEDAEGTDNLREILITYAIKDLDTLPQNPSLEISTLTFTVINDMQTQVSVNNQKSQVVFIDESEAEIKSNPISINPNTSITQSSEPTVLPTIQISGEAEPIDPPPGLDPIEPIEPEM